MNSTEEKLSRFSCFFHYMKIVKGIIQFSYNARYFKFGRIDDTTVEIWFVFHGYGQMANYFLRKFDCISGDSICVIAPEGLSRFYLEGFYGKTGATWMTKEERETDIENYLHYLNAVYYKELSGIDNKNINITFLGFSQGAATASRWAVSNSVGLNRLILWAGIFPPDLNVEADSDTLKNIEVLNIYGRNDAYLNNDVIMEQKEIIRKLNVYVKNIVFDGGHEMDSDTLESLR